MDSDKIATLLTDWISRGNLLADAHYRAAAALERDASLFGDILDVPGEQRTAANHKSAAGKCSDLIRAIESLSETFEADRNAVMRSNDHIAQLHVLQSRWHQTIMQGPFLAQMFTVSLDWFSGTAFLFDVDKDLYFAASSRQT